MSGPKVVRIVTREEILARCAELLARAAAALAEWERVGARNDAVVPEDIELARGRHQRLRALLTQDRLDDLQKQVPQEIAFLQADQQERLAKAAAAAAAARSMEQRRAEAAKSLLSALQRTGAQLEPGLIEALQRAAAGKDAGDALAKGFALLSAALSGPVADTSALIARYKAGLEPDDRDFAGWLAQQPRTGSDLVDRLAVAIAELRGLDASDEAQALDERLRAAADEADPARHGLLLDGLQVALSRALVVHRGRRAEISALHLELAELATHDGGLAAALGARVEAAEHDGASIEALANEVKAALETVRRDLAAVARRAAVLDSLAGLGYEVNEGLATSWVSQGRVVVRRPDRPGYGVELAGEAGAGRVQMRPVALDAAAGGPDVSRDRDAETLWCGDVEALKGKLARLGGELVIEKALPIGATPVKRVGPSELPASVDVEVAASRLRTID